jgi:hypothetical protein
MTLTLTSYLCYQEITPMQQGNNKDDSDDNDDNKESDEVADNNQDDGNGNSNDSGPTDDSQAQTADAAANGSVFLFGQQQGASS